MNFRLFLESSIIKPYVLPNNKEELFYDFYMCNLLLPQSRKAEIPKNIEPITKKQPIPLDVKQKSITSESYSVEEEAETELKKAFELIIKKIKEDLLHALLFGIICEMRHAPSHSKLDSETKEIFNKIYNAKIILHHKYSHEFEPLLKFEYQKGNRAERISFLKKLILFMIEEMPEKNDEDIVKFALNLFDNFTWSSGYGGKAWVKIAEAYLDLKKATTTNEIAIQIDHVFDLQHNSGVAINKSLIWVDNFGELDWLLIGLELKAHVKSSYELIPFISQQLKNIILPILKSKHRFGLDSPQAKKLMFGEKYTEIEQLSVQPEIKEVIKKLSILFNYIDAAKTRYKFITSKQLKKMLADWFVHNIKSPIDIELKNITKLEIVEILKDIDYKSIKFYESKYDIYEKCFIYVSDKPIIAKYYPEKNKIIIERKEWRKDEYSKIGSHIASFLIFQYHQKIKTIIPLGDFINLLQKLRIINKNLVVKGNTESPLSLGFEIEREQRTQPMAKLLQSSENEFIFAYIENGYRTRIKFKTNHIIKILSNIYYKNGTLINLPPQTFTNETKEILVSIPEVSKALYFVAGKNTDKHQPEKLLEMFFEYMKKSTFLFTLSELKKFLFEISKIRLTTNNYFFSPHGDENKIKIEKIDHNMPGASKIASWSPNGLIYIGKKKAQLLDLFPGMKTLIIKTPQTNNKNEFINQIRNSYNYPVDWIPQDVIEDIAAQFPNLS